MKSNFFIGWLRNLSISKKLYILLATGVVMVYVEIYTIISLVHIQSSARILNNAEAYWSEAERDAIFSLVKYEKTWNEEDYHEYEKSLSIPFGDKKARSELKKPNPDFSIIYKGFTEGRIAPNDIDNAINLLTKSHTVLHVDEVTKIWDQGENLLDTLHSLGDRLHGQISSAKVPQEDINLVLTEITKLYGSVK